MCFLVRFFYILSSFFLFSDLLIQLRRNFFAPRISLVRVSRIARTRTPTITVPSPLDIPMHFLLGLTSSFSADEAFGHLHFFPVHSCPFIRSSPSPFSFFIPRLRGRK